MTTTAEDLYQRATETAEQVAAALSQLHGCDAAGYIRGAYVIIIDNVAREAPEALARVLDNLAERYPAHPNG